MIQTLTIVVTLFLIQLCWVEGANSKEPVLIRSFLTGNDYQELSPGGKRGYVTGFVDGVLVAPVFDAPKQALQWIELCIVDMSNVQIVAIVDKWLSENPQRWHQPMNMLTFTALKDGCDKSTGHVNE